MINFDEERKKLEKAINENSYRNNFGVPIAKKRTESTKPADKNDNSIYQRRGRGGIVTPPRLNSPKNTLIPPKNKKSEMLRKFEEAREPRKVSTGKLLGAYAYKGLTGTNAMLAKTADFLLPDIITPNFIQKGIDFYKQTDTEQQKYIDSLKKTKSQEVAGSLTTGLIQAIPNLVLAVMTGGGSAAAGGVGAIAGAGAQISTGVLTGGRLTAGNAAASSAATFLQNVVSTNAKNPMFWNSFAQTLGPTYENEKAKGANEMQAITSAMLNATVGAAIEIGGGIETIKPIDFKNMPLKDVLKTIGKSTLKTAGEEGLEEVEQYSVEQLASMASGTTKANEPENWFSMDRNKDAVINPLAQAEQFGYGAAIGGIMGGTNSTVNAGLQKMFSAPEIQAETKKITNYGAFNVDKQKIRKIEDLGQDIEMQRINGFNAALERVDRAEPNEQLYSGYGNITIRKSENKPGFEVTINGVTNDVTAENIKNYLMKMRDREQITSGDTQKTMLSQNRTATARNLKKTMSPETESKLVDIISKRSGLNVVFEDLGDGFEGKISGNTVTISRQAKNPIYQVLKHELTHHIENSEHYDSYKDFIITGLQESGHDVDTEISNIVRSYADKGITLSDEEAKNEYVANFSEEYLFNSEKSISRLARENPNLFVRIYDWIIDTLAKVGSSSETKFLIDAQRKYEKALRTVKQNNNSNTIFFAVKDSSKDSIKAQIKSNIANIDTKKVVSVVEYEAQSGKTRTQMIEYYKKALKTKITAPIQRQDFGDVRFEIKDISRGLEYLNTDGERAAMLAVPDVIKRGSAIFDRTDHKRRGYDTVTFAGLVTINGKKGVVGVVVKRGEKNVYKTHRILMPDGTEYVFDNKKTEPTDAGVVSENNQGQTISSVSVDSITQGAEKGNEKFSISYTDKNVPVVVVNDDILRYSPNDKELIKNVKKAVSKFRTIPVYGQEISTGYSTKNEYTQSKYSNGLKHSNSEKYLDKMRVAAHPFDVIYASTNYINESPNHVRKDNIVNFSRGSVLIDVNGRKYSAEVVIGITKKGKASLYDIVNIKPDSFRYKKEATLAPNTNESAQKGLASFEKRITLKSDEVNKKYSTNKEKVALSTIPQKGYLQEERPSNAIISEKTEISKGKFSISESAADKNMLAIHNLNKNRLADSIKRGGFPMPSIAVVKDDMGHGSYGDSSLVFGKDSIDPKHNKNNKIYGGDVWSPTYPEIDYKANEKVAKNIRDEYYNLARRIGYDKANPLYKYAIYIENELNNNKGEEGLKAVLKKDIELMQTYLDFIGKGSIEKQYKRIKNELDSETVGRFDYLYNTLGKDFIEEANKVNGIKAVQHFKNFIEKNGDRLKDAIVGYYKEQLGYSYEEALTEWDKMRAFEKKTLLRDIEKYMKNGVTTYSVEFDSDLTKKEIKKAIENTGYERWIDELFTGIEEKTGIRNSKDLYTKKGNRRKWEALHWENTLENVVRKMKTHDNGEAVFSGAGIWGVAAKQYESIEKMKADTGRLKTATDYKTAKEEIGKRFETLAKEMMPKNADNHLISMDKTMLSIVEAVRDSKSPLMLMKNLKRNTSLNVTNKNVYDLRKIVEDIAAMPTEYFEAKPERIVGFDEVKAAVLPDDTPINSIKYLEEKGIKVLTYKNGDEADRLNQIKTLDELKFSKEGKYINAPKLKSLSESLYGEKGNKYLSNPKYYKKETPALLRKRDTTAELKTGSADSVNEYVKKVNAIKKVIRKASEKLHLSDDDLITVNELLDRRVSVETVKKNYDNADNIITMYEIKKSLREVQEPIRKTGSETRAAIDVKIEKLLEKSEYWKDKKHGVFFERETAERNMEDIMSKEDAAAIIEYIFTPIHQNEAIKNREKNIYAKTIKDLNISSQNEFTVKKVLAANKLGATVYDWIDAPGLPYQLKETKGKISESALVQLKGEGKIDDDFIKSVGADPEKINNAVNVIRGIYKELFEKANAVLIKFGYDPIEWRDDYFPHFSERRSDGLLGKIMRKLGYNFHRGDLPTDIAGLTENFKPGKKYVGNFLERTGSATEYDALKGLEMYLENALEVIHHTEDIQKVRRFEIAVRTKFGEKGYSLEIAKLRKKWEAGDITDAEYEKEIDELQKSGPTKHGALATWLREYGNLLAGKQSHYDRSMEKSVGRSIYDLGRKLESTIASNMVGLNISSASTNFIPLIQAGYVSPVQMIKAAAETLASRVRKDNLVYESDFLTNRRGGEKVYRDSSEKLRDFTSKPMEAIDSFTSETIVRAKYNELIKKGISHDYAMAKADRFAADVIADRSKGAMPTLFAAKNPLLKAVTMFQLEVNNQWSHLFKDIPRNSNNVAAATAAYLNVAIGSYLFNDMFEALVGRRPALDIFSWINDIVGDATGAKANNFVEAILESIPDEEDDFWENIKENLTKETKKGIVTEGLVKNIAEDTPFIGSFYGGGRLPIEAAKPDFGKLWQGWGMLSDDEATRKKASKSFRKEISKPLTYLVPPTGGAQLKKTVEGIEALVKKGSYGVDSKGNDILQYSVDDDYKTVLKSVLFGKSSTKKAKEWIENDFDSLSDTQTKAYIAMLEEHIKPSEAEELARTITSNKAGSKLRRQIGALKIESDQKNAVLNKLDLYNNTDYNRPETLEFADLGKDSRKIVSDIEKATGKNLKQALEIYNIIKAAGSAKRKQALMLMEAGYGKKTLKKLGYSDSERGALTLALAAKKAGITAEELSLMFEIANVNKENGITQKEVIEYLTKRNDLTREQKYYAMIAMCAPAERNNPWR